MPSEPVKHDHRQSTWLIAGGYICWCYQCGAFRHNGAGGKWTKPTGIGGINPAMKDFKPSIPQKERKVRR